MASGPPSSWLPEGWTPADVGHGILDAAGLVPVLGEGADLANAAWYAVEGDYLSAGLSVISMVPIVGDVIGKGGKLVTKLGPEALARLARAVEHMDFAKMLAPLAKHPKIGPYVKRIEAALESWRKEILDKAGCKTPAGRSLCPQTAARIAQANFDEALTGFTKATGDEALAYADRLAELSTRSAGNVPQVVLGKWPGYIDAAKKAGGSWFETDPKFFPALQKEFGAGAAEKAWMINEAFLRRQLESGARVIEITSEGLAHAAANANSMTARELAYLAQNAKKHGFEKVGQQWLRK